MYVVVQRRQSKYIWGGRSRRQGGWQFFLILDLKMANCGAFLVQFIAVQLVALHALSSAYERIEQKAAKQGYWKLYIVAFFYMSRSSTVSLSPSPLLSFCVSFRPLKVLPGV